MSNYHQQMFMRVIIPAIGDTIIMHLSTIVTCTLVGFIIALVMVTTDSHGLRPNRTIYEALSFVINIFRSVPFVITMITIIPLTRAVVGSVIGVRAAVFSITIAGSPFVARQLEGALKEVDPAKIEAAKSFGASDLQITFQVIVAESVPALISSLTFVIISLLGYTAQAGIIGAGGLGAVALTYGYQNFDDVIMYSTVLILIVMVQLIQLLGSTLYRKIK